MATRAGSAISALTAAGEGFVFLRVLSPAAGVSRHASSKATGPGSPNSFKLNAPTPRVFSHPSWWGQKKKVPRTHRRGTIRWLVVAVERNSSPSVKWRLHPTLLVTPATTAPGPTFGLRHHWWGRPTARSRSIDGWC